MIKRSLSGRLAFMFAVVVIVMGTTSALLLRSSLHETLQKQMHNELLFRKTLMEPSIQSRTSADGWNILAEKFANMAMTEGGRVKYWVLSDDPRFKIGDPTLDGVNISAMPDGFNKIPSHKKEACTLFLLISHIPGAGDRPDLRYVVALDSTPYIGTLNEFSRTLVIITIGGAMLVALMGYVISKVGMRPVYNLSAQANVLAPGNYGQRMDISMLPDELQQLAIAFNGALERQDLAWRQLESFNADVAHELRTPLTNLIGQTQFGLSHAHQVHELEDLLASNLEELDRMTSIVNDMLFLSHAQAGEHATQLTEVSLREETFKTIEYVEPSLAEKNLTIQVDGEVMARIDRRLFHRALANLLENSARHSAPNGVITIKLSKNNEMASISVSNPGEPIPPQHLARLFERFYRVDSSRSRSHTQHGLGLSIVRAVALMHHGEVFASSQDGLNTFGLTMSIASRSAE